MASRDYYRNLSLRLSRVMDYIGVNEEAVMSRRRNHLICENLLTLSNRLLMEGDMTYYLFGSQTEGTTTAGLRPDYDYLALLDRFNLVEDQNDWVPGKPNLLMIPNKRFPGYCKLQRLKSDGPCWDEHLDELMLDDAGRVILPHYRFVEGEERHGPANIISDNRSSVDFVYAIRCKTWPNGYKMWSQHPRKGTWPTPEMISFIENSGCFVVPVAHRLDEKKSESWRISTSLAERCLMFSLNITQVRCYTLIKMIVKTFIDPVIPDVISSYICKNLLFHCIENTRSDFWQESNLLRCVNQILQSMLVAVLCMNCPSYFNESINLLLGKVNKDNQVVLMGVIWKELVSDGRFLAEIRFDYIHQLIHSYDETNYKRNDCSHDEKHINTITLRYEERRISLLIRAFETLILSETFNQRDLVSIQDIMFRFALQGTLQYILATLMFPFLCSHLATREANEHILRGEMLSDRTSLLYDLSLDSDLTSSRLKYASSLYCTGQFERVRSLLKEVLRHGEAGYIAVCLCDEGNSRERYIGMNRSLRREYLSTSRVSMCVMFSQAERRCCPRELQYDMYRSTEQEKLQRDKNGNDAWMDLACIDSLSYLFFLWYMLDRHLGHRVSRLHCLEKIKNLTNADISHRDTVYNLLGQCYEYENKFDEAFACYCKSLRLKPTNNAARWHIVLLLHAQLTRMNEAT